MTVERQTIPHLNALVSGSKILEEQPCSSFRGCHATSSLKSVFFTRKVAWLSLIELHGCSWDILEPTSRDLKWVIICFSSITCSLSNLLFTKYSNPSVWYFRSVVYLDIPGPGYPIHITKLEDIHKKLIIVHKPGLGTAVWESVEHIHTLHT